MKLTGYQLKGEIKMPNQTNSSERTNTPTLRRCATIELHQKLLEESEQYKMHVQKLNVSQTNF